MAMDRKTAAELEKLMRLALREAGRAGDRGEVPVGAVVVLKGKVIGRGFNRTISRCDPSAHAEIVALRQASQRLHNHRLTGCDLVVSLEPCAMCLGAAIQARIRRIVFGAADPKSGAASSLGRIPFAKMNHRPEIRKGILEAECGQVLKDFFKARRPKASS
jgi:tRNA(adenine34) deaminase